MEYFPKRNVGEKAVERGNLLLAQRGVANAGKYAHAMQSRASTMNLLSTRHAEFISAPTGQVGDLYIAYLASGVLKQIQHDGVEKSV